MKELGEYVCSPGADPRQWFSNGTVDSSTDGDPPVKFDADLGPLVDVKLHPSGTHVRCRVSSSCAGNGEGAYFPFVEGDEVQVAVPQGDERSGCVIVGRTNNKYDRFPKTVAGQDVTKNAVAFQRTRCPYVIESAESIFLRTAVTGSYVLMEKAGNISIVDGFKNYVHAGADFIGIICSDDDGAVKSIIQCDRQDNLITLEVQDSAKFTIKGDGTVELRSSDSIEFQTAGMVACEHIVSTEAVANIIAGVLVGLAAFSAPGAMAALAVPGTASTIVATAISMAGSPAGATLQLFTAAVQQAINGALAMKQQNSAGLMPGVGCPGLLVG
jgi:hypothetical protein